MEKETSIVAEMTDQATKAEQVTTNANTINQTEKVSNNESINTDKNSALKESNNIVNNSLQNKNITKTTEVVEPNSNSTSLINLDQGKNKNANNQRIASAKISEEFISNSTKSLSLNNSQPSDNQQINKSGKPNNLSTSIKEKKSNRILETKSKNDITLKKGNISNNSITKEEKPATNLSKEEQTQITEDKSILKTEARRSLVLPTQYDKPPFIALQNEFSPNSNLITPKQNKGRNRKLQIGVFAGTFT